MTSGPRSLGPSPAMILPTPASISGMQALYGTAWRSLQREKTKNPVSVSTSFPLMQPIHLRPCQLQLEACPISGSIWRRKQCQKGLLPRWEKCSTFVCSWEWSNSEKGNDVGKGGRTGEPCPKIPDTYVKDSFSLADRWTWDSTQYCRDSLPVEFLKGPEQHVLCEVKKPLLEDAVSLGPSNVIHQA